MAYYYYHHHHHDRHHCHYHHHYHYHDHHEGSGKVMVHMRELCTLGLPDVLHLHGCRQHQFRHSRSSLRIMCVNGLRYRADPPYPPLRMYVGEPPSDWKRRVFSKSHASGRRVQIDTFRRMQSQPQNATEKRSFLRGCMPLSRPGLLV